VSWTDSEKQISLALARKGNMNSNEGLWEVGELDAICRVSRNAGARAYRESVLRFAISLKIDPERAWRSVMQLMGDAEELLPKIRSELEAFYEIRNRKHPKPIGLTG